MKDKLSNKKNAHYSKPAPKNQKKFGVGVYIIGAGVMGSAIAKALANKGQKVFVYDRTYAKAKALAKGKKIIADKNFEHLGKAEMIIVAVKPQDVPSLALEIKGRFRSSVVIISVAAGVKIAKLQQSFRHKKVVRVMPNLGLSVGLGIAAWKSAGLSRKEKLAVRKLFNQITENFEVNNEAEIDSVTAISGSGPVYFFYFAAALQKSAKALGLKTTLAKKLVAKTFSAAAQLGQGQDYQQLINQVASKGGTTAAALKIFEKRHLDEIVKDAARAAYTRAGELSKE